MLSAELEAKIIAEHPQTPRASEVSLCPDDVPVVARAIWDEETFPDRSKRDAKFVLACIRGGLSEARTRELLWTLPQGKAATDGRGDDYWGWTLGWAKDQLKADQVILARLKALRGKDALTPDGIDILARAYLVNRPAVERAMKHMKKVAPITQVRKEVLARVKAIREPIDMGKVARNVVEDGKSIGWWIKTGDEWLTYPFGEIKTVLEGRGMAPAQVAADVQALPWTITHVPFAPEVIDPTKREWNKDAARFLFEARQGAHPTWAQLLRVLGRGVDDLAREAGYGSGAFYLLVWIATMVRTPRVRLPYLFFWGVQNIGKSSFHERLGDLFEKDRGYAVINQALRSKDGFNGEMSGAVLCVADEIKVREEDYRKIKLWTTAEELLIHPKGSKAYHVPNNTHFVQTGNSITDCPQAFGDTRVTTIQVFPPDEKDKITKDEMRRRCIEEAPAFIWTLQNNVAIPDMPPGSRLGLPILESADKLEQQLANRDPLHAFFDAHPEAIGWDDKTLYTRFAGTLSGRDSHEWTMEKVLKTIPAGSRSLRRLTLFLKGEVRGEGGKKPWKGTLEEFRGWTGPAISGGWPSPESLGAGLTRISEVVDGLTITRTKSNGARIISVS